MGDRGRRRKGYLLSLQLVAAGERVIDVPATLAARTCAPGELDHVDVKKIGRIPDGGGWRAHGRQMGSTSAVKRAVPRQPDPLSADRGWARHVA
jgi:hypothetical protein